MISVAIPAYNAERTLKRAVDSILNQSHRDLEVIIVNNGSRDKTGDVAKALAASDKRVRVFEVYPNVGGYGARLYAWKRMHGDYFTSIDADDYVSPDMYERMYKIAKQHDLDVVECDYDAGEKGAALGLGESGPMEIFDSKESVYKHIIYPSLIAVGKSAYIWNRLYRNQYDFTKWIEGTSIGHEDLIHNLQLFPKVERMARVHVPFYHYMPNPASVTRSFSIGRIVQFGNAVQAKKSLLPQYGVSADSPVFCQWVVNDAFNCLVALATFGRYSVRERSEMFVALKSLPDMNFALAKSPWSRKVVLARIAFALPARLGVGFVSLLMRVGRLYGSFVRPC